MKKTDEKLASEAVAEAEENKDSNIGDHSLQTVPTDTSIALPNQFRGINIEGLESIPASMIAVPFCRLIQPTSKKTTLSNGKEATPGFFMFNDVLEEREILDYVLLRAKTEVVRVDENGNYVLPDYDGVFKQKQVLKLLGYVLDMDKIFILTLTTTSFSNWGKLLAQMKGINLDKTYRMAISSKGEKRENKKGKFYVVTFQLGKEISPDEFEDASEKAKEYGVVLDRQIIQETEDEDS